MFVLLHVCSFLFISTLSFSSYFSLSLRLSGSGETACPVRCPCTLTHLLTGWESFWVTKKEVFVLLCKGSLDQQGGIEHRHQLLMILICGHLFCFKKKDIDFQEACSFFSILKGFIYTKWTHFTCVTMQLYQHYDPSSIHSPPFFMCF